MTIDITKPLELSDGTPIVKAIFDRDGDIEVTFVDGSECFFKPNGEPVYNWVREANGRTLRNVKEPVMRTGLEQLERMEALVRRMAMRGFKDGAKMDYDDARAIVAELDWPKTDEEWALKLWVQQFGDDPNMAPCPDTERALVNCIAKGRELERNVRRDMELG